MTTATASKPKKTAKKKAPAAPPAAEESTKPALPPTPPPVMDDCCDRANAEESHAPGCDNYVEPGQASPEASQPEESAAPAPAAAAKPKKQKLGANHHLKQDTAAGPLSVNAESQKIRESRELLKMQLEPGQRFFESPEGYVMIGEADQEHVWCRHAKGGKGMFINPRREGGR